MVKPFNGFVADDGTKFETEIEAIGHEVKTTATKSFPELKAIIGAPGRFEDLCELLKPYACHPNRPTPAPEIPPVESPETTRLNPSNGPKLDACPGKSLELTQVGVEGPVAGYEGHSKAWRLLTGPDEQNPAIVLRAVHLLDEAANGQERVHDSDAPEYPGNRWEYAYSYRDNEIFDVYVCPVIRDYRRTAIRRDYALWPAHMSATGAAEKPRFNHDPKQCAHSWQRVPGMSGLIDQCVHCKDERA